jgi:signal transduction histidine kinase
LLDVHRPDTGDLVDVAINPLIDRILLLTGGMLAEHHVMIIRALSDAHLVVRGYPNQLTQVMLNLVVNAIDAMPEGGQITLQTSRTNRWPEHLRGPLATLEPEQHVIVITISDTGKGIHPEIREEIFRPFFTTRAMGTGLGLAISQQIVQRHGGAMGLQSQLGYGSTFLVALPAV